MVAAYLLVAIELTSWARRLLPRRLWHTVHLSSLLLFAFGTVHAVQSGTDTGRAGVVWAGFAALFTVSFLTMARVLTVRTRTARAAPVRQLADAA